MKFGPVPVHDAEGAILAHSTQAGKARLKKGLQLDADSISQLLESGLEHVIVARLDTGDIDENKAAGRIAAAFLGAGVEARAPATGRVNLHASSAGLFRADKARVDAFNSIDPAITYACLNDRSVVAGGDMVATIKIIPLAVAGASVERAETLIAEQGFSHVRPFALRSVGYVATALPTLKPKVMVKTRELTASRLAAYGATIVASAEVGHEAAALASELEAIAADCEMIIIFGASAVTDTNDVIPAAIRQAGGHVERVGMPVDPGNLIVIGSIGGKPVIGAPGCARSPRENGFDWVLARIMAGESPGNDDLAAMGVGGLLMEIPTRPQPRLPRDKAQVMGVGIVLMAAGRASRMGEGAGHKLLAEFDGEPLVRLMAQRALASRAEAVAAVTGFRAEDVAGALEGLELTIAENTGYASGMASSLKTGVEALGPDLSGIMILLGDMPKLETAHIDLLLEAFGEHDAKAIIRAADGDHRGNPVILPASLVPDIMKLEGDVGARALIEQSGLPVIDIDIGPAARIDVDTPEAVRAAGGRIEGS
ncbi:4-diphosphocytidyl-2C-methyl-D-erythritol kinase [Pseudohoeflea suaedae]|uniref:4-diphosphocytidyl-2C-methyl-D-erythritol kinase n=1 Tax=Pseudohoeflea suaedae TaxID=877384 RepID=A0A4R5PPL9_9HYPH|nr:molybdopterin-binding/glycosyltransferase family 2 protein [Pseudohoeflea suaedae]TDH39054.1 4-diphosphocytidyl-2C-methyl-D-erythritol kinase [Pseudohoeflea suaedae]